MKIQKKTGKKTVNLFLISFPVPEISAFKEVKNGTEVVHQNKVYRRNFAENGEICDVNKPAICHRCSIPSIDNHRRYSFDDINTKGICDKIKHIH